MDSSVHLPLGRDVGLLGRAGGPVRPFIVYSLPRARTAWLSEFLSYDTWKCHHEAATSMRSIDDVSAFFAQPCTGTVETAAAQGWRLLHHHVPGIRATVIRRPVDAVMQSMLAVDLAGEFVYDAPKLRKVMEYGDRMLAEISAQPKVLTVAWEGLGHEDVCAAIFEHCLPLKFDRAWLRFWWGRNVQIDIRGMLRDYHANRAAIDEFKSVCWRELRALRRAGAIVKNGGAHGHN